ncbi:PAS domain-containing protein [Halobaculum sp. CBA1158]|uniref:PAS domain-containing protein n=1 Tax=Halobaculum sp. CBA1158 TaxID=2904243 RepID=UPI001F21AB4A|nr:PAS domain-containing protein [Halobaculum sp. CBA1158]UIP00581.1 PAS domain-containing protein [Halobaculum sp. CBA1158]
MSERSAATRVQLVVEESTDRDLLRRWLEDADGFEPVVAGDGDPFDAAFDVCLLDVAGARDHGGALAVRKRGASTYLPALLYVPERYGDPERALAELPDGAVDDVIAAPVRRAVLARRLRSLGRARTYSTELAASRNRFQRLLTHHPDGVFVCADGVVSYANPAASSLLGVPAERLEDTPIVSLALPADRDRVAEALATAAAGERAGPIEVSLTRSLASDADGGADVDDGADGVGSPGVSPATDSLPVELTAVRVDDDDVEVLVHDLREHRANERQLSLYGRAMNEATVGITICDHTRPDDPLIYVNEEFERLTGYDAAELLGRNPRMLQTNATDPEPVARIRRAIENDEEASVVLLNRRKDGRAWYNALDISPVRDADGEVTHYLGFQRDVTDRVSRNQRLTVLDRVLRHNVRNRLNVVVGYADEIDRVLREALADDERGAGAVDVERLRESVDRIDTAATDILDLSDSVRRFREDVVAARERDPVDAGAIVRDAVTDVARTDPTAELRLSLPAETVHVAGAAPISLVAEELVTNAVQHGGDTPVTVSVRGDGDEVVLRVLDEGPGITADSRAALDRGTESQTRHGQGVGLWLVRWTVDAAGGTVDYAERDGGGAVVTARFPVVDPDAKADPDGGDGLGSDSDGDGDPAASGNRRNGTER